jgi:hypothetical protein
MESECAEIRDGPWRCEILDASERNVHLHGRIRLELLDGASRDGQCGDGDAGPGGRLHDSA